MLKVCASLPVPLAMVVDRIKGVNTMLNVQDSLTMFSLLCIFILCVSCILLKALESVARSISYFSALQNGCKYVEIVSFPV